MLTWPEFLLVGAVALAYAAIRYAPRLIAGSGAYVTPAQIKRELDAGTQLLLLDVRSTTEFSGNPGHIPGAVNVPLSELGARLTEEDFARQCREHSIVAVCRSDARAAFAVRTLRRHGVRQPRVMSGGISGWAEEGFPIEQGPGCREPT